jgi:hypothetical protein
MNGLLLINYFFQTKKTKPLQTNLIYLIIGLLALLAIILPVAEVFMRWRLFLFFII